MSNLANKRAADAAMAGRLKKAGIERTPHKGSQRCPICNHIVSNAHFYSHTASHK